MLNQLYRLRRLLWALLILDSVVVLAVTGVLLTKRQTQPSPASSAVDVAIQTPGKPDTVGASPTIGQVAPDFTLKSLDGGEISLSQFKGQPVLINFWASWCAPCRAEMPDLVRVYEARQAEGLVILGVNQSVLDARTDVQSFVDEFRIRFPVLLDEDGAVAEELYRLRGIPTSIFIDRKGAIVRRQIGISIGGQLDALVDEIMR